MPKHLHERGTWKRIELPATEDIYNDKLFACLDSIEELTDYDFDPVVSPAELEEISEDAANGDTDAIDSSVYDRPPARTRKAKKLKRTDDKASDIAVSVEPGPPEGLVEAPKIEKRDRNVSNESAKVSKTTKKKKYLPVINTDLEESAIPSTATAVDEWSELHLPLRLLEAVKTFGFTKPTEIQERVIPTAMGSRRDVVGAAETGSGKTLAFLLPVVHHMLRDLLQNSLPQDATSTLILAPTRELAQQVHATLVQLLEHCGAAATTIKKSELRSCLIIGGLSREKQQRLLRLNPHIIVGTPGRVWDQFQGGEPCMQQFSALKYLVIDEADRMVEKGHFPELTEILHIINTNAEATAQRQNYVFSATLMTLPPRPKRLQLDKKKIAEMTLEAKLDSLMQLIGFKPNPKIVDLTRRLLIAHNVHESRVLCTNDNKDHMLYYLLTTEARQRTLVFCNSIDGVRRLRGVLTHLFPEHSSLNKATQQKLQAGHVGGQRPLVILHSKMHQRQRLKYFERFSAQEGAIFLCTDVAARGLDFPHVEHVIHYQVPRTFELYVHRSGRTARAHAQGKAVLMVAPSEAPMVLNIMSAMKRAESELPVHDVDRHVYERLAPRVDLAREIDVREHRMRRDKSQTQWLKRAAHDADIDDDDDDAVGERPAQRKNVEKEQEANVMSAAARKALATLKHRLRAMLVEEWRPRSVLTMSEMKFPSSAILKQQIPASTEKRKLADNDEQNSIKLDPAEAPKRNGKRQKLITDGQNGLAELKRGMQSDSKSSSLMEQSRKGSVMLMTSKGPLFV